MDMARCRRKRVIENRKFGLWDMSRIINEYRRLLAIALVSAAAFLVAGALVLSFLPASAQGLSPDQMRALAQSVSGNDDNASLLGTTPQTTIQSFRPVAPEGEAPGSALEGIYSARAGQPLTQFGYSIVGVPAAISTMQSGAVQDDYVLGVGDQIDFNLRGQENAAYQQVVDTSGHIILPKLAPIMAAGRRFGDFRHDIEAAVAQSYVSTKAFVSLSSIRQISVLVSGAVRTPGTRILSALGTPLDAILLSGGITKSGSLRNVGLVRNGTVRKLDLYSIVSEGGHGQLGLLRDGDRIYVPPLGATVAVAGDVRRPAIYELPAGVSSTTAHALLDMGAGVKIRGVYRLMLLSTRRDGKQELIDVTSSSGASVRDGEVLIVQSAVNDSIGGVTLTGAVRVPGSFSLTRYKTLRDLLPSPDTLAPQPYLLLGVVFRIDRQTLQRVVIPFSPLHVLQGKENLDLTSEDVVRILNVDEMRQLAALVAEPSEPSSTPENPEGATQAPAGTAPAATALPTMPAGAGSAAPGGVGTAAGTVSASTIAAIAQSLAANAGNASAPSGTAAGTVGAAPVGVASAGGASLAVPGTTTGAFNLGDFSAADSALIGHVLGEYIVRLNGAVRNPGVFLVMPGTTLDELVLAADGLNRDVDLNSVEITSMTVDNDTGFSDTSRRTVSGSAESMRSVVLGKYDQIVFHHVYSDLEGGAVKLSGEVRYPGSYQILRGERLSSVLERAGGLTEFSYAYGALFFRSAAKQKEREGYDRAARALQSQLLSLGSSGTSKQDDNGIQQLAFLNGMISELRATPALGRVSIVADPVVLAVKPELDPILQPGDELVVPKRPIDVTVSGEVLGPGSFLFRSTLGYDDYIHMAGGYTRNADDGLAFIILPDGSSVPTSDGWLTFGRGGHIPPGSTIVVPRDLRPFDWGDFLKDATDVFSKLAISAASLAVLKNN